MIIPPNKTVLSIVDENVTLGKIFICKALAKFLKLFDTSPFSIFLKYP